MQISLKSNNYMTRAIELALLGGGHVHPNPCVGAVIVKDGLIVAEGYHHKCGDLHAERDALKNAKEKNIDVAGCDMYVTLEPCCHTGKQPPCTQAIIESKIKRVFIGSRDPNPLVDGKGVKQLEEARIEVIRDFEKEECDKINSIFFHYIKTKMPYVIAKYAMTADGKTSLSTGESKWITGEVAREDVHKTRGTTAAIMCGINTVLADDPLLNCRIEGKQYKQPVRVILDRELKLSTKNRIAQTAREYKTILFCAKEDDSKKAELEKCGIEIIKAKTKDGHLDLEDVLKTLGEKQIDSVLVESGGMLNASLFFAEEKCLVNEVHCYVASKITGGKENEIHSPVQGKECKSLSDCVKMKLIETKVLGDDVLLKFKTC